MKITPLEAVLLPVDIQGIRKTLLELEVGERELPQANIDAYLKAVDDFIALVAKAKDTAIRSLVIDGEKAQTVTPEQLKALQQEIIKAKGSKDGAFATLTIMSRWVEVGNDAGYWRFCPPPLPVLLKAPLSPFSRDARGKTDVYAALIDGLKQSLKYQEDLYADSSVNIQLGQFLVSAILLGDIHDRASLKALLGQLDGPLNVEGELCWLDLQLVRPRQIANELRRWFPDPLTELLFYKLNADVIGLAKTWADESKSIKSLYSPVRQFLRWAGVGKAAIPSTFSALFDVALYQRMLDSSAVISAYTGRKFVSHSPREGCWYRLIAGAASEKGREKKNEIAQLPKKPSVSETETVSTEADSLLEPVWLLGFRQAVFGGKEAATKKLAKKCKDYLETLKPSKTMRYLVPKWIEYLLTERQKHKGKLAASTIKGFLSSTGKRLVSAAGDVDITSLDEAGFEDLYWQVLEDAESGSLKRAIGKGLTEFHEFLTQTYKKKKIPELKNSQSMGMSRAATPVDANLISLDEYDLVLERLLTFKALNDTQGDLGRIAKLIVILGFRCGLRRSEVLKLRIVDYHPSLRSELLVRPWSNRSLKTKSSTRKLPVHVLLTKQELKLLDKWHAKRLKEVVHLTAEEQKEAYLFALPEEGKDSIEEETLFKKIHIVLRTVTQDDTLRFHHLRHSFATWTAMRLMLSDLKFIPVIFPRLPRTQEWLEQSSDFRKRLYLNDSITRKHIYAVSSLLGHGGPDMSLEHYIHGLDLISMLTRQSRINFADMTKVAKQQGSTAYTKGKDGDMLAALLEAARNAYARKGKVKRLDVLKPKALNKGETDSHHEMDFQAFEELHTFLLMYLKNRPQDFTELRLRFGYTEKEAEGYLQKLSQFTEKGRDRLNPKEEVEVLPAWRLNNADEDEFRQMAGNAFRLMKDKPEFIASVYKYYEQSVWETRNGLIIKKPNEIESAKQYVQFLKEVGFDESRIELAFFEGATAKQMRFWRSNLGLRGCQEKFDLQPQNKANIGMRNAARIKVLELNSQELDKDWEAPYLKLLMLLLGLYTS